MSKAFTKDDDSTEVELDLDFDPVESEMLGPDGLVRNYITPQGLESLKAQALTATDERQARLLKRRIETAIVVDPAKQSGDRVLFGATVHVTDEDDRPRVYKIVGAHETDSATGQVSWISPIAKALLNKKVGEGATVLTPHGEEEWEVQKIEFK